MTDDNPTTGGIAEDAPQPALDELQQREESYAIPPVVVCLDGPAQFQKLPNRRFSVSQEPIDASGIRVLTTDLTRAYATVMLRSATATDFFRIKSSSSGQGIDWPANVPFIVSHCDEVFAAAATPTTAVLSVAVENYAD